MFLMKPGATVPRGNPMESNSCRELDWLITTTRRGAFGLDRHVCVVRCSGSRRSRNGRERWTRALAARGAGAMGTGIWPSLMGCWRSSYRSVAYHWPTVLLSLFAAIVASSSRCIVGAAENGLRLERPREAS